jgi:hypothetical protein
MSFGLYHFIEKGFSSVDGLITVATPTAKDYASSNLKGLNLINRGCRLCNNKHIQNKPKKGLISIIVCVDYVPTNIFKITLKRV